MHSKGHFGLTLLIMSLLSIPFGTGENYEMFAIILFTSGLSSLPDLDLKFGIPHRKYTHNILFALLMGILFGILFGYASGLIYGVIGFIAGFSGVMLHLLGDVMTYMTFKPFYPFSQKEIAYGFFPAKSKTANDGFFTLGIIAFFGYVLITG